MTTHFIAHEPEDSVGVIVVEDIKAGDQLTGWLMTTGETLNIKALGYREFVMTKLYRSA